MLNFQLFDTFFWSPWVKTCDHLFNMMLPPGYREPAMRKFIRHPSDIPIDFQVEDEDAPAVHRTKDISAGGLCFTSTHPIPSGKRIHIHIPDVLQARIEDNNRSDLTSDFDADGIVAWCRKEGNEYAIGVRFDDKSIHFGLRMVEQVCHIEHYRYDVLHEQGRQLSAEEAAKEWIERYAAEFPA